MRVGIAAPVWKRPKTTALWWKAVQRLQAQWSPFDVRTFVAGSEPDQKQLCLRAGGEWLERPNDLGEKFNSAVEAAWGWGADYVVILGSDDLLSPALADEYKKVFARNEAQYLGLRGCYMVEPVSQRGLYLSGHANRARLGETVGAGRTLSRSLLDKLHGRPWPSLQRGADMKMTLRLKMLGVQGADAVIEKSDRAFLLDVKGGGNLWDYDHVARNSHVASAADYETLVGIFPQDEQWLIRELEGAACPTCGHTRNW